MGHAVRDLIVYGVGGHVGQILEIGRATELALNFYPACSADWYGDDIKIVSRADEDLMRQALLVGSFTDLKGGFSHKPDQVKLPAAFKGKLTLKHPAVLTDYVELDLRDKVVLCGYPGSGNGVVSAFVEHLLPRESGVDVSSLTRTASAFVSNYYNHLQAGITMLSGVIGADETSYATYRGLEGVAAFIHSEDVSFLFGLPLRNYCYERVHKTHEPMGQKIRAMVESGAQLILVRRHPLDILVSVGRKLGSRGLSIFTDREILKEVLGGLVNYYESFVHSGRSSEMIVVAYEDIFYNCRKTLITLFQKLKTKINTDLLEQLERELLYKPIAHEGHYWQPGQGKWRKFIPRDCLELLIEARINELCKFWGYEWPDAGEFSVRPDKFPVDREISRLESAWAIADLLFCITEPRRIIDRVKKEGWAATFQQDELLWVSSSSVATLSFQKHLAEADFLELMSAGSPCSPKLKR